MGEEVTREGSNKEQSKRVTMKPFFSTKFPSAAFGERSVVNLHSTIMMHCLYFTSLALPAGATEEKATRLEGGWRFQSRGMENIRPYASKGPPSCRMINTASLLSSLPTTMQCIRAVMQQFTNMRCCAYNTVMLNLHYIVAALWFARQLSRLIFSFCPASLLFRKFIK